ncbi:MAG TPA: glycosyltransferase [Spirochaetota bacterium]|nr:glycosyltransferase [Spirochaetota bacterium]
MNSWLMNGDPLVSVCCITYTHEKFICDAIEGFLMQKTDFPFEIIIHDDASTDRTADIIRKYEEQYPDIIKTICQTHNQYSQGKKPMAEFVFPMARGKYLALCEGDDYWIDPLKLQKQVDFLESNDDYVICCHDAKVLNMNTSVLLETYSNKPTEEKEIYYINDFIENPTNFIPTASIMFRKEDYKYFQSDNKLKLGDIFLIVSLAHNSKRQKIKLMKDVMSVYRIHEEGVYMGMNNVQKNMTSILSRLKISNIFPEYGENFYFWLENRINTIVDNNDKLATRVKQKDEQMNQKVEQMNQKVEQIKQKDEQIKQKDEQIKQKDEQIKNVIAIINSKDQVIDSLKNSYTWRLGRVVTLLPEKIVNNIKKYYNKEKIFLKSALKKRKKNKQKKMILKALNKGYLNIDKKFFNDNMQLHYELSLRNHRLIDWEKQQRQSKNRDKNKVSIIIPIYGQPELTKKCLESIYNTPAGTEFEVIVVDNGSDQNTKNIIRDPEFKKKTNFKVITNKRNLNFALGCNIGFSFSIGYIVVFLNNDTIVTENWLINLIKPLLMDNEIVATQPKLIYPDNTIQSVGIVFSDYSCIGYNIYQGFPSDEINTSYDRNFKALCGACMAVKAKDFADNYGFDSIFINGQEDIDFCLRLVRSTNKKLLYTSSAKVYHFESKTSGRGKYIFNNRKLFKERWENQIIADDFNYYNEDHYKIINNETRDDENTIKNSIAIYIPILEKTNN